MTNWLKNLAFPNVKFLLIANSPRMPTLLFWVVRQTLGDGAVVASE